MSGLDPLHFALAAPSEKQEPAVKTREMLILAMKYWTICDLYVTATPLHSRLCIKN